MSGEGVGAIYIGVAADPFSPGLYLKPGQKGPHGPGQKGGGAPGLFRATWPGHLSRFVSGPGLKGLDERPYLY